MREILFKAKVKDWEQRPKDEQWIYGYYVRGFNVYEEPVHMIFDPTTMFFSHGETDGWDEIDPSTLCQYTGLTDKNGNKIWENDVVYIPYERLEDSYCKVVFRRGGFIGEMEDGCEDCLLNRKTEVIGNKFDNPELLKGE